MARIRLFAVLVAGFVLPLSLSGVGLFYGVQGVEDIPRTADTGKKMRISSEATPLERYPKLANSDENNTVERVVILTLDAFRPTYINRIASPTFDWILEQGTSADYAITVNPTVTAPTHVSIACGATAGTTGIIGNTFYDWEENTTYSLFPESGIVHELVDLIKVPPAFILAENTSVPAAAIGWPYSGGAWADGTSLTDYISYGSLSSLGIHASNLETARLTANTIVENPELKLIYGRLPGTDYAAHYYSESSAAVTEQIQTCEEGLRTYFEILQDANLLNTTVTVILSDHGMMPVSNSQFFLIDQDYFKDAINKTGLTPLIARDAAYDLLYFPDTTNVTAVEEFASYLKGQAEIDAVFTNEEQQSIGIYSPARSANISIFFKPGISSNFGRSYTGMHGYLNSHSGMRTLFMMVGPSIVPNKTLASPPSVLDATPTAFQLLGLSMAPHFEGKVLNEAIGARGAELQFPTIIEITPAPNSVISESSLNITAEVPNNYGVPTIEAQISTAAGFNLIKNMSYDAESRKYWVEYTNLVDADYEVILKPYSEAMPFSRMFSFKIEAVDDPPSLAITFPVNGTTTTQDSIMVIVEATDDRGAVASVEAQVGTGSWVPLPSIGASDYSAILTGLSPGQNIIKIRANDTGGNVAQITLEILAYILSPTTTPDTSPDTLPETKESSEGVSTSIFMILLALVALGTLLRRKR
jgi:predicted AlkP superfamily pyrophosphatase or phosphodiesterase